MSKPAQVKQLTLNPTYKQYWEKKIAVIPEYIKDFNWSCIYRENWKPDEDTLFEWELELEQTYALVTGAPSGVIGIDFDFATEDEIATAIKHLGDTPCKKRGSKGLTAFYKYNNERNLNFKKDGVIKCELLSTGRRTTIPPTKHRKTGKPYQWIGEPLWECIDRLPSLPANYQDILDSIFLIIREPERDYPRGEYDFKPSYNDAVEALNYCDASCANDDWVKIGMAFKAEVGDAGFSDFDNWSSKGKSYDKRTIHSRWRTFDSHSISYGTLVYFAKQGGYRPPQKDPIKPTISMSVDEWTSRKLEAYAEQIKESATLPDFYTNAPHHIKEICDWIVSTARYPQPIITMGAVLAFLGFYMGREFRFKGIKANIYNINLARTGHGKEHIIACIRGLMHALDMTTFIGGSGATSDTAMLSALKVKDGKSIYIIDEFQGFMKVLSNSRSANSREAGLVGLLLKAYTSRMISGVDYADRKENETVTIPNPYMSLCSFCTPEPFFDAVGSAEAFNGFIGRLTVFEAPKILPQRNKNHNPEADLNIPDNIVQMLKDMKANRKKEMFPDGSFQYLETTEVPTTKDADELLENMNDEIDDKRREYDKDSSQMSNVIARIFEMMKKYALIASRGKEITVADVTWAKAIADYNVGIMISAAQNLADTKFERKKNHVIEFIQKRGGMVTKTHLTNYCKIFESRREREEIIADLVDNGRLKAIDAGGLTKSATGYELIK